MSEQQIHPFNTFNSVTESTPLFFFLSGGGGGGGGGVRVMGVLIKAFAVDMRYRKCDIQSNIMTANISAGIVCWAYGQVNVSRL